LINKYYFSEAKRFLGLPSISEIRERIREKLKETLGSIQDKIMEVLIELLEAGVIQIIKAWV
jgi:hypothetical protein